MFVLATTYLFFPLLSQWFPPSSQALRPSLACDIFFLLAFFFLGENVRLVKWIFNLKGCQMATKTSATEHSFQVFAFSWLWLAVSTAGVHACS